MKLAISAFKSMLMLLIKHWMDCFSAHVPWWLHLIMYMLAGMLANDMDCPPRILMEMKCVHPEASWVRKVRHLMKSTKSLFVKGDFKCV